MLVSNINLVYFSYLSSFSRHAPPSMGYFGLPRNSARISSKVLNFRNPDNCFRIKHIHNIRWVVLFAFDF